MGDFNQLVAHISLCSRFALCNKTNIKCSYLFTKRKTLGIKVIKFSDPSIGHVRVILGCLYAQDSLLAQGNIKFVSYAQWEDEKV